MTDRPALTVLDGKYELGEVLGTGGMGTVYRATHLVLGCPVAVKLMHGTTDASTTGRFLREARLAAAARHPNVVSILDFGTTPEGAPFMVMELLEGKSLADLLDHGPRLSVEAQVAIIEQVLSGLDAVHRAGIVHRDLKPANVFVTHLEDGRPFARLLDFGISFSITPTAELERGRFGTDTHDIIGTPEYMSFEQAEGRADVDVRADVYAVGVMLYEMLSGGQLPYSDVNPGAVLFKIFSGNHVPLAMLRPDLPELSAVVAQALQSDRDNRPPTARAFRRAILQAHGRYERSDPEIEIELSDPAPAAPLVSTPDRPTLDADSLGHTRSSIPMVRRWRTPMVLGLMGIAATVIVAAIAAGTPGSAIAGTPGSRALSPDGSSSGIAVGSADAMTTVSIASVPSAPDIEDPSPDSGGEESPREEDIRAAAVRPAPLAAASRPAVRASRPERAHRRAGEVIRQLDF